MIARTDEIDVRRLIANRSNAGWETKIEKKVLAALA